MALKFFILVLLLSLSNISFGFRLAERDSNCPNGTTQSNNDPNKCYKFMTETVDWYTAEGACEKLNGYLVSVHNAIENAILLGTMDGAAPNSEDFWIGGSNNNKDNAWAWKDGTKFDFDDWAPGNPTTTPDTCLAVRKPSGFWYSTDCRGSKPSVCIIPAIKPLVTSCPSGWSYFDYTKSCYIVIQSVYDGTGNMTCQYGKQACNSLNSTLTSIHSVKENFFIAGLAGSNIGTYQYTVLGLVSDQNTWRWLDSSQLDYNNWQSSTGATDNYCAYMYTDIYTAFSSWHAYDSTETDPSFTQAVCKLSAYRS